VSFRRQNPVRTVRTIFDCKHERLVDISIDDDVEVPDVVRGLGKCPECKGEERVIAVSGVAPQPGGRRVVLDSILMIPIES
jgi:hypothetical protein